MIPTGLSSWDDLFREISTIEYENIGEEEKLPSEGRRKIHSAFHPADQLLDEVNTRLLTELHADPRVSMSALARRVGMSAPAVTERVQRLERAGVITGYAVQVDPAALGLPVTVFARVRPGPGQLDKVAALAESLPEVSECYRITGEDCFLLKVHVPSVDQLDVVLDRFLLHGQTTSSVVVSTPVPARPLPVDRSGD